MPNCLPKNTITFNTNKVYIYISSVIVINQLGKCADNFSPAMCCLKTDAVMLITYHCGIITQY